MSTPSSFRFPFTLPEDVHPGIAAALKNTFNGLLDNTQAIAALSKKVSANTTSVQTVTKTVQTIGNVAGTPITPAPQVGNVNLQPNLTPGLYTTAQADYGGLILVNSSIAFALTLNSGVTLPWYTTVYCFGSGTVTATPDVGNVNGGASVTISTGHFATIFFDPTRNFWALIT